MEMKRLQISLLRRQQLKNWHTIKNGKAEIKEFYKMSTQLGAQLALNGPVRAATNAAAFAFSVTTQSPQGIIQVDVIDTFGA